ncbi:hypothetical protein CLF_111321 [Clonorchis sinensis]|uniref:Uncharacterized protein n=1 Tax=Clonorchis sinensis TaxID=79923 RepID=G7YLM6_CLOSI|nr:hypothetical protein CLF_111321 [Clonorchis sinensis]
MVEKVNTVPTHLTGYFLARSKLHKIDIKLREKGALVNFYVDVITNEVPTRTADTFPQVELIRTTFVDMYFYSVCLVAISKKDFRPHIACQYSTMFPTTVRRSGCCIEIASSKPEKPTTPLTRMCGRGHRLKFTRKRQVEASKISVQLVGYSGSNSDGTFIVGNEKSSRLIFCGKTPTKMMSDLNYDKSSYSSVRRFGPEGIRCSTDDSAHLLPYYFTDFQVLYGAYALEYTNPVVYSGRTKDVTLTERVQRAATKIVAGLKSVHYETRLAVLDFFSLKYRRLRGDLILTYALFEQGLADRFFTVDPANTRRGHGERRPLNDKNKTDPGNLGGSLDPVYQSVIREVRTLSTVFHQIDHSSTCSEVSHYDTAPIFLLKAVARPRIPISYPPSSGVLNDLENLRTRVYQMENGMSALRTIQSIACLLNPDATCDPPNLEKASILIDMIAPEICQRIECRHQVLIFNAPDRIPLEHTKTTILTACGMQDNICTARRLRKSKPSMCCPIILQFRDEKNAARLLAAQILLSSTKKFQTLKIKAARTRLQRQLTKKLPQTVAPSTASTCADACHNVTQSCLLDPGPAPHAHDHEPSTSISGHPQVLSLTTTPTRSTADLRDTVTNQPTHEAVVEDDSTGSFFRHPDLMTLRVSPPNRFLGLKHLLSKPRTVTPSPAPTPRAPALRPSSTNLTTPVIPHKRICSPSNRATQFPDGIFKPQLPLPNPSPYQVPPLWQPAPVWLPVPSATYDSMLKALQDRSIRPLSASVLLSHSLFLKHFTCPSIPRDLNNAVSIQLPHTVPPSDNVDYIITNDCPTQPVTLCPWSSAACTATQMPSPYPSRYVPASYSHASLPGPTSPTNSRAPDSRVSTPVHSDLSGLANFLLAILATSPDPACNISVFIINTRSLLPELHYTQAISTIACPTFICITETWISPSTLYAFISLPGYAIFRSDRSHCRGGGCLIHARTEIKVCTIDDPLLADTPDPVWLSACRANPPFILGCLYIPPPHSTTSINCLSTLLPHTQALPHPNKPIVEDVNLSEIARSQQNSPLRLSLMLSQLDVEGWSQLVRHPTRGAHTLDIALVNGYLCPIAAVGPKFPDDDHCIVTCSWTSTQPNPTLPPLTSFVLSPGILEAFAISLRHKTWDEFFLSDDTQSLANLLYGNPPATSSCSHTSFLCFRLPSSHTITRYTP